MNNVVFLGYMVCEVKKNYQLAFSGHIVAQKNSSPRCVLVARKPVLQKPKQYAATLDATKLSLEKRDALIFLRSEQ